MKFLPKQNICRNFESDNKVSVKSFRPTRLRSEANDNKMGETQLEYSQPLTKTHYTHQQTQHSIKTKKNLNFQYQDYQKILMHNKLTLDFTQPAQTMALPQISTFKKTHKLLIPSSLYKQFKEIHKVNGHFQSVLSQVEREYNIKKMKINITKDSKITFRQNVSLLNRPMKQSNSENQISNLSKNRREGFSFSIQALDKLRKKVDSLPNMKQNRWKLKDFYDPLVEQMQQNELLIKKINERQKLISRIKQIESECFDIELNNQTSQSIEAFSKYTKNMGEKLVKKKRKIDKIYFYSY